MHIQLVSDLHIEFWKDLDVLKHIKPVAPILILLGDICCASTDYDFTLYKNAVSQLTLHYDHIIIITGNHEYYTNNAREPLKTISQTDMQIKAFCKTNKKLHFLQNKSFKLKTPSGTYLFIGSTLWSNIPRSAHNNILNIMSDYSQIYTQSEIKNKIGYHNKQIRLIKPADICSLHKKNVSYIEKKVRYAHSNGYKCIVLTHHKPYLKNTHNINSYDPAYETDLKYIFPHVLLWAYGHTHIADNRKILGAKLYSNPHGYPNENTNYNPAQCIKI